MSDVSDATSASTATFLTALALNGIVFGIEIAAFTILRPYFKAIYEPNTYVPPQSKRVKPLAKNMFLWPYSVLMADYKDIIRVNGLDAYFFTRFLRVMVRILLPIWLLTWAVLLPVNSVKTGVAGNDGLDHFTYGNIAKDKSAQTRYASHLILVYLSTLWVLYNLKSEMRHFIITRQQHLINRVHIKSVQANTLLIQGVPARYLNEEKLYDLFRELPGGVKKIWINRNLKDLPDIYDRRAKAENKLEGAETKYLKIAAKIHQVDLKKLKKSGKGSPEDVEASRSVTDVIVPTDQRPTHKLGFLGLFGQKVDTIDWARKEIRECTELLAQARSVILKDDANTKHDPKKGQDERIEESERNESEEQEGSKKMELSNYPAMNSAFITFNKQIAAHLAFKTLTHHEPYRMATKYVEVAPSDVIWGNLNLNPYEQKIRLAISYAATAALIIFWSIPVAFVGFVSNVHQLCATVKFLSWICGLPPVVVGIISGILPPVLLAVLMMLLPIILRLLARFEGIPKYTGLELSLMTRFFIFQVIHSFLIVTLSSGLINAIPDLIKNPTGIPGILASKLPKASNFFLTYIILQGLSGTAAGFLQIVPLIIYYVKLFILGSTPRSVYGIKYGLRSVAWGTLFPGITLLTVITLAYSIISPIINGLACAAFFLFYLLYKYLFLWAYGQPATSDTGGLFYPKAIQHVFVGLYIQQICLCALFFLAQDSTGKQSAIPEGALMIVLIVITAGFHAVLNNSYGPLISALPLTLANQTSDTTAGVVVSGKNHHHHTGRSGKERASEEAAMTAESPGDSKDPEALSPVNAPTAEDEYGFAHPAISRPQRTIWIPKDHLGLAEEEVAGCREAGVEASEANASLNEKGKVDISGAPPGEVVEV